MSVEIEKLIDLYEKSLSLNGSKGSTFLSVISKDYHENYLSRLIAYALSEEGAMIAALLRCETERDPSFHFAGIDDSPNIVCEKNMNGRRADIFIEFPREKITVTVENKTNTAEHDDQTRFYYRWVMGRYKGYKNIFFYLCPDYNISRAGCEDYINITYSKLASMIPENTEDPIVKDLKKHIEKKLGVENMKLDGYVLEIVKNYDIIQEMISKTKSAVEECQREVIGQIEKNLSERFGCQCIYWKSYKEKTHDAVNEPLLTENRPTDGIIHSYRFYRPDWFKAEQYYFYVEILFCYRTEKNKINYGDIRGIEYQRTLKWYSNKDVKDYFEGKEYQFEKEFIIFESEDGSSIEKTDWNVEKWRADFIKEASEQLAKYIEAQTREVAAFKKFYQGK